MKVKEGALDEERLVLATGRYIGEGFDDAGIDTLFLALPVSWKGTLVQYAGRLHRHRPEKREVRIYDYVDRNVQTLVRMFEKRMKGYGTLGYRQRPSGAAHQPGNSLSSGRLTLSDSIRAASEIRFDVALMEKNPYPKGRKNPRGK